MSPASRAAPARPSSPTSEVLNVRDYLNDGGKALVAGKFALQSGWDEFLFNPLGAPPNPFCKSNQTDPSGDDDPPGQNFNCVKLSNDFQQYWLGAYLPVTAAADTDSGGGAAVPGGRCAVRQRGVHASTARTRPRTRTTSTRS